jgi:hypothetical protein
MSETEEAFIIGTPPKVFVMNTYLLTVDITLIADSNLISRMKCTMKSTMNISDLKI